MKSLADHLNDQLEQRGATSEQQRQSPGVFLLPERERFSNINDLVTLASHLQQMAQIQPAPDFARYLERRLKRRQAELRLQGSHEHRSGFSFWRVRRALALAVGVCLLLCLLSSGMLALAAQVTDPTNPLYTLTRWEQQVRMSLSSPADQAILDLQFAQARLQTLSALADATHEAAYQQALADLDFQVNAAASAIKSLPAGSSRNHLAGELASLKKDAIQTLRLLLPRLTLQECLATTSELARVGDRVPLLVHATLTFPASLHGHATISLFGTTLEEGARLLVNGRLTEGQGTLSADHITFIISWNGQPSLQSLGILNLDGTAAQTTAITIEGTGAGSTSKSSQGHNQHKPTVTPTPNRQKPPATPTPNGQKPTATPTPHR